LNLIPRTSQQIVVAEEFFANWTERPIGVYPATHSQDDILVSSVSQRPKVKRALTKVYPQTPRYRSSQLLAPLGDEPRLESALDLGNDAKPVSMLSVNENDFIPDSVATDSSFHPAADAVDAVNSRSIPDNLTPSAQFGGSSSVNSPVPFLGVRSPRARSEGSATFSRASPIASLHDDYDTKSEHNSVQGVPLLSRSSSVSAHQPVLPWHEWVAQRTALAQSLDPIRKNVASAKFVDRMAKARGTSSADVYHPTTSATEARNMLNRAGSRMSSDRALIPRLRLARTPVGSNALSLSETFAQGTLGHGGIP